MDERGQAADDSAVLREIRDLLASINTKLNPTSPAHPGVEVYGD